MPQASSASLRPSGAPSIRLEEEELRRLASRSPRLGLIVEASSRRRDVRRTRARLLLLLLSLSCPRSGPPARPWYVPGAVARMGPAAIARAWVSAWGGSAPCERTLRRHLVALEELLALVREPGARIAALRSPGRAPRLPDTLHVLDDEREAAFWEVEGAEVVRRHPEVRTSPEAWRRRLGGWRNLTRTRQLPLFEEPRAPLPMPGHEPVPREPAERRARALELAQAVRRGPLDLLGVLERAGVHASARGQLEALARPATFRRAAAIYALALSRGSEIRDGWAWFRRVLRTADGREGERALARLGADQ